MGGQVRRSGRLEGESLFLERKEAEGGTCAQRRWGHGCFRTGKSTRTVISGIKGVTNVGLPSDQRASLCPKVSRKKTCCDRKMANLKVATSGRKRGVWEERDLKHHRRGGKSNIGKHEALEIE